MHLLHSQQRATVCAMRMHACIIATVAITSAHTCSELEQSERKAHIYKCACSLIMSNVPAGSCSSSFLTRVSNDNVCVHTVRFDSCFRSSGWSRRFSPPPPLPLLSSPMPLSPRLLPPPPPPYVQRDEFVRYHKCMDRDWPRFPRI